MKMRNKFLIAPVLFLVAFTSCKQEELEQELLPNTQKGIQADWVMVDEIDPESPYMLHIYNTSDSEDSLIVNNLADKHLIAKVKVTDNNFSITDYEDADNEVFIDITGQLVNPDSIYIEYTVKEIKGDASSIVLESKAGGHKFTGFNN